MEIEGVPEGRSVLICLKYLLTHNNVNLDHFVDSVVKLTAGVSSTNCLDSFLLLVLLLLKVVSIVQQIELLFVNPPPESGSRLLVATNTTS